MLLVQGPHPKNHWISGKLTVPSKAFPTTQSRLRPHPVESPVAFPSPHTPLSECCVSRSLVSLLAFLHFLHVNPPRAETSFVLLTAVFSTVRVHRTQEVLSGYFLTRNEWPEGENTS